MCQGGKFFFLSKTALPPIWQLPLVQSLGALSPSPHKRRAICNMTIESFYLLSHGEPGVCLASGCLLEAQADVHAVCTLPAGARWPNGPGMVQWRPGERMEVGFDGGGGRASCWLEPLPSLGARELGSAAFRPKKEKEIKNKIKECRALPRPPIQRTKNFSRNTLVVFQFF